MSSKYDARRAMPDELMRSAPVPVVITAKPEAFLDERSAQRFAVETAAANAFDQLPEGYRTVEVRLVARRVRGPFGTTKQRGGG